MSEIKKITQSLTESIDVAIKFSEGRKNKLLEGDKGFAYEQGMIQAYEECKSFVSLIDVLYNGIKL